MLQPREKISLHGPKSLDDHELLALLLGRGNRNENIFTLSRRIFSNFDREEIINQKSLTDLRKSLKIGTVQTAQIMACVELGRRFFSEKPSIKQIRSTDDLFEIVSNMKYLKKEYLRGLYLNTRYKIIHDEIISIGSLDANILHPRDIFRPAIEYNAYAVIMAHNHPSGDFSPSRSDIETTKIISQIGDLLQIPLLDHLIVGSEGYYSFNKFNKLA